MLHDSSSHAQEPSTDAAALGKGSHKIACKNSSRCPQQSAGLFLVTARVGALVASGESWFWKTLWMTKSPGNAKLNT